ncbi:MAG: terminase large subunit domain-containing protein [Fusobacteriaceae bacterium]
MSLSRIRNDYAPVAARVETVINRWQYSIFTASGTEDFKLTPMQATLWDSPHRVNKILKSRQLGITSVCVLMAVNTVIFKPGRVSIIVCPSESQVATTRGIIDQILCRSGLTTSYKNKQLEIQNGGKIIFVNSNYASCRGVASDFIYVTEGQSFKDINAVLEAVLPTALTRPDAKIFIDGTMPDKANNSFLALFSEITWMIPAVYEDEIYCDESGKWILFNKHATREQIGDTFDREILMELPSEGVKCSSKVASDSMVATAGSIAFTLLFIYNKLTYKAVYYSNGYLAVGSVAISTADARTILLSPGTFIAEKQIVNKLAFSKSQKADITIIDRDELAGDEYFDAIYTNVSVDYYLSGHDSAAYSPTATAAMLVNLCYG